MADNNLDLTNPSQSSPDNRRPMMDVAHPSSVGAEQTSKPVITNNQPLQQDPMMNQRPAADIESRIVSKMPAEKLDQEMNAEVAPVAEQGTLHNMFPNEQVIGHVKPKGRKRRALRRVLLIVGFMITLAAIGYYVFVFIEQ